MTLPPRSTCTCPCHGGGILHAFPCCEPDRPKAEAMAMDRHSVRDRIASRIEALIRRLQPPSIPETEPERINRLAVTKFEAKVILDASGLMERIAELEAENSRIKQNHGCARGQRTTQWCGEAAGTHAKLRERDQLIEALQAELRHLKGRPAVSGKPLELQSRDELLAEVRKMEAELARKDATLRLTARWFAMNADEFDEARKADSESVVAEIGKALSPAPATEESS